ncbi:MAG: ABC transporter ATP-binding protein [Clostridia bacterium]|nr:ABC transporter ATP-binding protein [Clostridia bacterium]
MIEFFGLSFLNKIKYPDSKIEKGTLNLLIGPSGSGKSSLLKILNATVDKSSGTVKIDSKPLESYQPLELRKKILMASQHVFLFPGTIEENFDKFYEYRQQPPITNDEKRKFLNICKIDFPLYTKVDQLSGGEKQRIFISICISFRSEILFLDEPTSGLDLKTAESFAKNLKDFFAKEGMTVIVVSHDVELFSKYADFVIDLGVDHE